MKTFAARWPLPLLCAALCHPAFADSKAAPPKAAPAAKPAADPVAKRAASLREAADLLERAQKALAAGDRNLADLFFSQAELLVGAELLAELAEPFRAGGPPRVRTPIIAFDKGAAPQPAVVGSSEEEDEQDEVPPPEVVGSLTGTLRLGGRAATGVGLVTLEPVGRKAKKRPARRRIIEQRGREFLPKLTAVSVGSTIVFPNFDTVFHNVFSTSPTTAFDLGLYRAGEARELVFSKEGVLRIGCNLHASMSAYIAVVSAPHYTVTDSNGAFTFRRLSPGKYKLSAWNERSKAPVTKEIVIKAGKNRLDLTVTDDGAPAIGADKFGGKRG